MQTICCSLPRPLTPPLCQASSQLEERGIFLSFPSLLSNPGAGEGQDEVRETPLLGLGRGLFHPGGAVAPECLPAF